MTEFAATVTALTGRSAPSCVINVLRDLAVERDFQACKFPAAEHELEMFHGLSILGEEKGECDKAANEAHAAALAGLDFQPHEAALRAELVQVAAVAIKLIGLIDREGLYIALPMPQRDGVDVLRGEELPYEGNPS